jgi:hypothetical protein
MWDFWWTKWHWDRFFSEFFGFLMSISFHRVSTILYITWGMKSRPTDDRCSETVSPIDKNNKSQTKILHAVYPALREGRSESIQ